MSTQQSSQADEMDLTDIFTLIKRAFYNVLALCFRAVDFLLKFWWIILLLIVGGAALGYFLKGEPKYNSTLIIQTNFNTQPYVYNAVKQFNLNLKEDDVEFMNKVGLDPEYPGIKKVQIAPVIDVVTLMEEMRVSERTLGTIIKELSVEEETELFASERFYSNYKYHKLTIRLKGEEDKDKINNLMRYINEQPLMQSLKNEITKNMQDLVRINESTIKQIDEIAANYAVEAKITRDDVSKLSYFNNQNNININGIFDLKKQIAIENEEIKNELIMLTDAAVVVSDIQTAAEESLSDRKEIIYPIILVFLFLLFAGIRYTYVTLRKEVEKQNLLD
ncbi:hypothetical protein EAX61_09995 [Dokdonia sinensis]|uniref:Uncharacterized protein n=1 Tax=Dokdonia sinensis TaxID=2479847 RepID=A0A3M0GAB3_9FLAO|nr:hypothetical protein [Dokdonia sinensis]RMB57949.1 hypothetical protein EAX61_09995 [Dokdonia sinensis]